MNSWNYRVIKMMCDSQKYFAIAEVYYDEKNQPVGWVKCNENTLVFEEYGSRARTYGATGNYMASEPFCVYTPEKMRKK